MQTVQIVITPQQAQQWLDEKNTRNRPMSMPLAAMYADDMKNDRWLETHQGIAFYEDGVIADGQTRLKAITIAKKSIPMQVTFGIPIPNGLCIDIHRKRTFSNQLAMTGELPWLGKNEAATAMILMFKDGGARQSKNVRRVIDFCTPIEDAMVFMKARTSNSIRYITTAPVKAAIVCAYYKEDKTRLDEFCKVLISGIMKSGDDSAAVRLRERLISGGGALQSTGASRINIMLLTMRAISFFCKRQEVSRLTTPVEPIYAIPTSVKS